MGSEAIKGRAQQQQADNLHRQASQQNASHAVAGNQLRRVQRGDEVGHAERDKAIPGLPRRHSQTGLHGQRHTEDQRKAEGALPVDARMRFAPGLRDVSRAKGQHQQADRHINKEGIPPA